MRTYDDIETTASFVTTVGTHDLYDGLLHTRKDQEARVSTRRCGGARSLLTGPVSLRSPSLPRPIRRGLNRLMVFHQYIDRLYKTYRKPLSQSRPTDLLSYWLYNEAALHCISAELSHPTATVDPSLPGPSSAEAAPPADGTASAICIKWNLGRYEGTPCPKTYCTHALFSNAPSRHDDIGCMSSRLTKRQVHEEWSFHK
jgi:hypothetical protein